MFYCKATPRKNNCVNKANEDALTNFRVSEWLANFQSWLAILVWNVFQNNSFQCSPEIACRLTATYLNVSLLIPTPLCSLWLSEELKRVTWSLHGVFQNLSLHMSLLLTLPSVFPFKKSVFPALTVSSCLRRRPCWMRAASMGLGGEAPVVPEL